MASWCSRKVQCSWPCGVNTSALKMAHKLRASMHKPQRQLYAGCGMQLSRWFACRTFFLKNTYVTSFQAFILPVVAICRHVKKKKGHSNSFPTTLLELILYLVFFSYLLCVKDCPLLFSICLNFSLKTFIKRVDFYTRTNKFCGKRCL